MFQLLNLIKNGDQAFIESSLNILKFITEGLVAKKDQGSVIIQDP